MPPEPKGKEKLLKNIENRRNYDGKIPTFFLNFLQANKHWPDHLTMSIYNGDFFTILVTYGLFCKHVSPIVTCQSFYFLTLTEVQIAL